MQSVKDIPEDKVIFLLLLCADILNTISRESITIATNDGGVATVVTYSIWAVILIILQIVYMIYFMITLVKNYDDIGILLLNLVLIISQVVASNLYFYGDNITYIVTRYGEELGCGPGCVERNRIAAVVTLGLSLLAFQVLPPAIKKLSEMLEYDYEETGWNSAMDMIIVIIKIDAIYTAVAVMAQSDEFCSTSDVSLGSSFVVICFFAGLFAMVVNCIYSCVKLKEINKTITLVFFLLLFCFPMYLLADNQQPIDCAFGCDTFAANTTLNDISCDMMGNAILRIGFMVVSLAILLFTAFCVLGCSLKKEGLPKAGII